MNRRRAVLSALAGVALGSALPARAQAKPLRVGAVFGSSTAGDVFYESLRQGFRDAGYVEGGNLTLVPYWGEESPDRLKQVVAEMLKTDPQVIVTQGTAAFAVHATHTTIPVAFGFSGDPVEAGFVQSLSRPGGNMTGISFLALELVGKRMEMLREVIPGVKRVAVVAAPQHPGDKAERRASEQAAAALGLTIVYFEARNAPELAAAMATIEKSGCDATMFFPVQTVISERERIAAWSARTRMPTVSGWSTFTDGGNLMSYGPNLRDSMARLAFFVDRIAKGTKPAVIPVELPTRVEFVINQKAAKALGITIPRAVELRADRVIA